MKYSEVLKRYVNTGTQIREKQYNRLPKSLQTSYMRMREIIGYDWWELKYLTHDDQRIKLIEKDPEHLGSDDVENLLKYSENKDLIITKIIDMIYKGGITESGLKRLLQYSKDKELIKKTLLQNGVDYKLINDVISRGNFDTPLIPDNYQEMLNEIRRIKQIMG
jgi:hypothetical protein